MKYVRTCCYLTLRWSRHELLILKKEQNLAEKVNYLHDEFNAIIL